MCAPADWGKLIRHSEQPFLSAKLQVITTNGEDVQVFEYRTAHAAEVDAQNISGEGSTSLAGMHPQAIQANRWLLPLLLKVDTFS